MSHDEHTTTTSLDKQTTRRAFVAAGGAALACAGIGALAPKAARADGLAGILENLDSLARGDFSNLGGSDAQAPADPAPAVTPTSTQRPSLLQGIASVDPAGTPTAPQYPFADDLSNVINVGDAYLGDQQLALIKTYGFFEMLGYSGEFFEIYESNRYNLFPNFVTVDSMMHTYHIYFAHLMKNIERDYLSAQLAELSATMLAEATAQLGTLAGTAWESAARLTCAFFGVGASLLDPAAAVPAEVADVVNAELALITEAAGVSTSPLTGNNTDYSQYIVRGYYEGDPALEPYFRAMMWYGGVNFQQANEDLDRAALLVTIALAQAQGGQAASTWQSIYMVTSFFAGASDDSGYFEYRPLVEQAYGAMPAASDLPAGEEAWATFHQLTAEQPAPAINSIPVMDTGESGAERTEEIGEQTKGFRFMGQRFTIDAAILQKLIYSAVGDNSAGEQRMLPDVLDVPAALGSDAAYALLEAQGATDFAGYAENMAALRTGIEQAPDTLWTASLASQWLATLRPLLTPKDESWPLFMQGDAWSRRVLQTFAGSYAELKHDTVLYAKQAMAEMGGGPIEERDDRGYVEPEPEVFGRLAALVGATSSGLASLGLLGDADASNLSILQDLATRLETIARKELSGELPTDEEFELIRSFGAQIEHFWQEAYKDEAPDDLFTTRDFPAAIITDIATDPNGSVLQIGTGQVSQIYVIVPVEGVLRIASGATYSFYQFVQPIDQRLTDTTWRQMLGIMARDDGTYATEEEKPAPVSWVDDFTLSWTDLY